ncbi:hypothetical protein Q1695_002342 [Nippostrongylus brasiliensis]|nr:hypothetical protein Q1695_002342 [Nippostrongylus brasiliensis]
MKVLLWLTSVTTLTLSAGLPSLLQAPPSGELYALLAAGSNGWYNYRHQADVAHAYHTLKNHGVKEENIIVMMYDDIANDEMNPYPGQLFNEPNGTDVYAGLKIDYKGDSVTPKNFLNVLMGKSDAVKGGNGRVINSTKDDRIFVYFTDHGSIGLIAFPDEILTAKQLNKALKRMHSEGRFSQLVFYLEACESGSMFARILKKDLNVYAVTAAGEDESSWGVYCDNDMDLPCLGDEFSVNWMDDSDKEDLNKETLDKQFEIVREETKNSGVHHYGDLSLAKEPVSWFQGQVQAPAMTASNFKKEQKQGVAWPSRDVELMHLQTQSALKIGNVEKRIAEIMKERKDIESVFVSLVNKLVSDPVERERVFNERNVVEDEDCHDVVVRTFDVLCIDVNKFDYALKHVNVLNNLCTKLSDPATIIKAMTETCSATRKIFF